MKLKLTRSYDASRDYSYEITALIWAWQKTARVRIRNDIQLAILANQNEMVPQAAKRWLVHGVPFVSKPREQAQRRSSHARRRGEQSICTW